MSKSFQSWLYLFSLILIFTFDRLAKHLLLKWSDSIIFYLQASRTELFTTFAELLAEIGDGWIYFLLVILVRNYEGRGKALYYSLFLLAMITVMNQTKIMFHEPRPYFTNDSVIPLKCSQEFGHPSGHSLFASGFASIIFLDYYHSTQTPRPGYYVALITCLLYSFAMALDRLYLAVHSLDHVLIGLALGFWLALFFHQYVRITLLDHVKEIELKTQAVCSCTNKLAGLSIFAYIALFAIQVLTLYVVVMNF